MDEILSLATKFVRPTPARDVIGVLGFLEKMKQAERYPVILVRAGAGYGKSTLLSNYFENDANEHFWLTLTEEDSDLPVFLENLVLSVREQRLEPTAEALRLLRDSEDVRRSWKYVLTALINDLHRMTGNTAHAYLVIDDYHLVQAQPEHNKVLEYLLRNVPPKVHVVLTSRSSYNFLPVGEWKLKGRALFIGEEDLALSEREIGRFLRTRTGRRHSGSEVAQIRDVTEGWAIAVEMVADAIYQTGSIDSVIANIHENSLDLFHFLAADILERLPATLRTFVLESSVLRNLNTNVCQALFGQDIAHHLHEAFNRGLLLQDYGRGNYGFHRLFRDFLLYTAEQEGVDTRGLRRRAAEYYLKLGRVEEAAEYLIDARAFGEAGRLILQMAPDLVRNARFKTLMNWLDALPAETYHEQPDLYILKGDLKRFVSCFDEALSTYEEANRVYRTRQEWDGTVRTLTCKALVYLDTVQPGKAQPLLQKALGIWEAHNSDGGIHVLELLAENNLNQGRMDEVARLIERMQASGAEPTPMLKARHLMRNGRLPDASAYIESLLAEPDSVADKSPKSHRELRLVLSLLYSLLGRRNQESMELAREVLLSSKRVGSRFVQSVAAARMGHAHLVDGDLAKAIHWHHEAVRLSDDVRVPRGKGEPLWGLTLAYGLLGDADNAELYADAGIAICAEAQDWWLGALTRLARGIGHYVQGRYAEALDLLRAARQTLKQTGDEYAQTVSVMWEAMTLWRMGDAAAMVRAAEELASLMRGRPYAFLLQRRHLYSPRDLGELKQFLVECRRQGVVDLSAEVSSYHPGYTLVVKTLGRFSVNRGTEVIMPQDWTRDKAKRLFQIMITRRGQYLSRDSLIEMLWPDKTKEMGAKNLKVTLSALNTILEPSRPDETTHFVVRAGDRYGIADVDSLAVDADRFTILANRGLAYFQKRKLDDAEERLQQALSQYQGDYLDEAPYEEWAMPERERLKRLFLDAADALAQIHLVRNRFQECLDLCGRLIAQDDCWENAYRLMIVCHARTGHRARAVQVYQSCKQALSEGLGMRPSHETVTVLKENIQNL